MVLEMRRILRTVAGVSVLVVLTGGCAAAGAEAEGGAARASDALVGAGGGAVGAPGAADQSTDPEAPAAYRPVVRSGKPARPSVAGAPGRFSAAAPVRYPDGVSVVVDRVARKVEQGAGVGAFPGRRQTLLEMTIRNGSAQALDLTQVVVTTTYGARPRVASPVYDGAAVSDFTGTVPPGGTATATYAFAIPPGQAKTAVTRVDFDGTHAAATFTGMEEG